jgi:hypothetical protein
VGSFKLQALKNIQAPRSERTLAFFEFKPRRGFAQSPGLACEAAYPGENVCLEFNLEEVVAIFAA